MFLKTSARSGRSPTLPPTHPQTRCSSLSQALPSVMVMSPTRELATQIYDEARKFTFETSLHTAVVYGGADYKTQFQQLEAGCDILVRISRPPLPCISLSLPILLQQQRLLHLAGSPCGALVPREKQDYGRAEKESGGMGVPSREDREGGGGEADCTQQFDKVPPTSIVDSLKEAGTWLRQKKQWRAHETVWSIHKDNPAHDRAGMGQHTRFEYITQQQLEALVEFSLTKDIYAQAAGQLWCRSASSPWADLSAPKEPTCTPSGKQKRNVIFSADWEHFDFLKHCSPCGICPAAILSL